MDLTRDELRAVIQAMAPLPIEEAWAFGRAWNSGEDDRLQEAARALITAARRPLPVADAAVRDDELRRLRHHGAIRGAALEIYDALRPDSEGP